MTLVIVKNNNYKVGFTTSDGIYIQNHMMEKGDTTGPISAEYVLKDPNVEFAVLETLDGGKPIKESRDMTRQIIYTLF